MFKLIPTDEKFFDMFTQSAELYRKGAGVLREIANDARTLKDNAMRLERLEHDADQLTHEVLVRLDRSFMTPIDREDIHRLTLALDDCMDTIEAATNHMVLYGIKNVNEPFQALSEYIEAQAEQIVRMMPLVKSLKWDLVRPHCIEINRLENEGDRVHRQALGNLFAGGMDVLDVIRWRDIYGFMEGATDKAEDVAGIVEGIVLKHG
jgi:predicted phosphate transport protein (TIGR00153 family)